MLLVSSKVSAVGIHVLYFQSSFNETTVSVIVAVDLTAEYRIYENDSVIANGTLFAYVLANITTARNMTENTVIVHSLFINESGDSYYNHIWLNFSYSNYFPEIHEFESINYLPPFVIVLFIVAAIYKRKKIKEVK